ncbi:MAG: chromosome segregation protein SMC [Proteobacteria bacterium]|nr:chromosome segregation protein SMC [Pseudomonadota bacterium]
MRLSKIKLAGFKSFVDPTTITFPSNLVGVVGPNGCGKSNVIDAVRWVMGESSASRLRGDSITDVIFNGSSSRKPIGAASVELMFDNSETTLEGQYAKYAEIAIRREVSRDGISTYYLNGTRCRRKDITGIFLGTGLGPRSYSIIEQGVISRMIEAKPEEMRAFLEEAAGISKYKERRRETTNRIRRTRDNLDRLKDVLEEVEKQIKHLDRQAKTAGRYERLKDNERKTVAELLALRLRDLDDRANQSGGTLRDKETAMEALVAEQRKIEAHIEEVRVSQSERSDKFNEVQGRFYKSGAEIARTEQTIEHAHELRERQQKDLEQAVQGATEIAEHINSDQSQIAQLDLHLSELAPGLEHAKESEKRALESLQQAEQALTDWQQKWDESTLAWNEALQTRNVEETREEQIQSRIDSLTERQKKLDASKQTAKPQDLKDTFEKLSATEQRKRQAREESDLGIADIGDKILKLREQDTKLNKLVDERRATLQAAQARYASLEAVQQAALGAGDEAIQGWLESAGLKDNERVAQSLAVESGWETAVETVLGDYLQAVCVNDVNTAAASLAQLRGGNMTLLIDTSSAELVDESVLTLASKVASAPAVVLEVLRMVRITESLDKALAIREQLNQSDTDASVITKDGVWLSRNWLRVCRDKNAKAGVLGREHDMRRLKGEIRELKASSESAVKLVNDGRLQLTQLEKHRDTLQRNASTLLGEYSEVKAELDAVRFRADQAKAQQAAIIEESGDIEKEHFAAEEQIRESRAESARATDQLAELDAQRAALESQREDLRAELHRVRAQADEDRMQAHDLAIQYETRRSSKDSTAQSLARMESQRRHFGNREQEIRQQLQQSEAPLESNKEQLEILLKTRVTVESELGESRRRVEEVEGLLRDLDQSRMSATLSVEESQAFVNEARMAVQEIRVRREGFSEQLDQTGFELGELLEGLDEEADPDSWDEKLEKIRRRIDRLGPINLAAIDEFKEQSERKEYLDSQLADLNDALATLEGAIHKIDRETRTRFRETFANVDTGFKRLFPKLFGGGHAYLELTGDDLLTAGVTVMARPPGKRNSTIHLLSGGEKALTAVALVFAIFELNPAPFCLLDEVDAPLDDANIVRFCRIVKAMADKVQFVFITHNKVTMEMARQLTGITMQEPGVSRVVAVDLDEAVKMAAS